MYDEKRHRLTSLRKTYTIYHAHGKLGGFQNWHPFVNSRNFLHMKVRPILLFEFPSLWVNPVLKLQYLLGLIHYSNFLYLVIVTPRSASSGAASPYPLPLNVTV